MMTSRALTEYVVLDIEGSGLTTNKFAQADAQVSPHKLSVAGCLSAGPSQPAACRHRRPGWAPLQASGAACLQTGRAVHV